MIKEFENGAPLYLPIGNDDSGWQLPITATNNAFDLNGFQTGDASLSPQLQGATATATVEVGVSGTYYLRSLIHEAASPGPGETIRTRFSLSGGAGGFADGFVERNADNPLPPDPWLVAELSDGSPHPGWTLETGVSYTLQVEVIQLTASPNPAGGFGIDGLALTRFDLADPSGFSAVPYQRIDGPSRYLRTYIRGSGGSVNESEITFESYHAPTGDFLRTYRIDRNAGMTSFEHNDDGLLIRALSPEVTLLDGGGAVRSERTFAYDVNRREVLETRTASDGSTTATQFFYDAYGRQTKVVDAPGSAVEATTEITFSPFDDVLVKKDPCGNGQENIYGNTGLLTDQIAYGLGTSGDVLSQMRFEYDTAGRLTSEQTAVNDGTFTTGAPAAWSTKTIVYDLLGRVVEVRAPGPVGDLIQSTVYDFQDNETQITNPDTSVIAMLYDGLGRVTEKSLSGPGIAPLATTWSYDSLGRLQSMTTPGGATTTYQYDDLSRPTEMVEAGVLKKETFYDAGGRIMRELVSDATTNGVFLSDTTYQFDGLGRTIRTRMRRTAGVDDDANDAVRLTVYNPGELVAATIEKGEGNTNLSNSESGDRRIQSLYDALGRVTQTIDPVGTTVDMAYDVCGNQTNEIVDSNGIASQTSFEYDALNRRTREIDPLGHFRTSEYDSRGLLLRRTIFAKGVEPAPDVPMQQLRFTYDLGGRQIQEARLLDPTKAPGDAVDPASDAVVDMDYDSLGRVTTITRYDGDPATPRVTQAEYDRSEERRVGKECRSRWSPYH